METFFGVARLVDKVAEGAVHILRAFSSFAGSQYTSSPVRGSSASAAQCLGMDPFIDPLELMKRFSNIFDSCDNAMPCIRRSRSVYQTRDCSLYIRKYICESLGYFATDFR